MARYFFEFTDEDDNVAEMATLEAAIVAAAASLALTALESQQGASASTVIVGDTGGSKARVSLTVEVEIL